MPTNNANSSRAMRMTNDRESDAAPTMRFRVSDTYDIQPVSSDSEVEEEGDGFDSDVIIIDSPTPPRLSAKRKSSGEAPSSSIVRRPSVEEYKETWLEERGNRSEQEYLEYLREELRKSELRSLSYQIPSPAYSVSSSFQQRSLSPVIATRNSRDHVGDADIDVISGRVVTTRSPSPPRYFDEFSPPYSRNEVPGHSTRTGKSYENNRFSAYDRRSTERYSRKKNSVDKISIWLRDSDYQDDFRCNVLDRIPEIESSTEVPDELNFKQCNQSRHPIQEEMVDQVLEAYEDLSASINCQFEVLSRVDGRAWRYIKLDGEPENVEKAKDAINDWIMEYQENTQSFFAETLPNYLITVTIFIDVPEVARSSLFGPKKAPSLRMLERSGVLEITDFRASSFMRSPPICIKGDANLVKRAYREIKNIIQKALEEEENANKVFLKIPRYSVGAIMGRKGAHIKRIIQMTRTKIVMLPDTDPVSQDRTFVVQGEDDAIQKALQELQKHVDSSASNSR